MKKHYLLLRKGRGEIYSESKRQRGKGQFPLPFSVGTSLPCCRAEK